LWSFAWSWLTGVVSAAVCLRASDHIRREKNATTATPKPSSSAATLKNAPDSVSTGW
jgi:hypothetical protein